MSELPFVDLSRAKPLGKGRITQTGSLSDRRLLSKIADYKQRVCGSYRAIRPCDIEKSIPPGRHLASRKYDGETWFLIKKDECVFLASPNGRVILDTELIEEAKQLLKNNSQALIVGELYAAPPNGKRERVFELGKALSNNGGDESKRLGFAAFDIIELDDVDRQSIPFHKRAELLRNIFTYGRLCQSVDFQLITGASNTYSIYHTLVEQSGAEGVVLRLENGGALKIKPEVTIDAAVVGATFANNCVKELLLALLDKSGAFRILGRISSGLSEQTAADLYECLLPKDTAVQNRTGSDMSVA